jgi:aldehyde:ferredoxin oxidoreductase
MTIVGRTLHNQLSTPFGGQHAYTGQILRVNLSTGALWVDHPDEAFYRAHLGGRGVILHYLLSIMPAGADPLSPENVLIFAPGLLTGTSLPGSGRHAVGGKSPLTGALASGEAGGWWGTELKRAGYDAVVIEGRSAEGPVYLWINDGTVEIRDARPYWGQLTGPTQAALREALGDDKVRVAQIGPAGEKLVRYAAVIHDLGRAAGRSGLGAVMGSKQLKAIAVRGTRPIALADESRLSETLHWILGGYKEMMGWAISRGTEGSVKFNHDAGGTGVRNYLDGALLGIEKLDGDNLFSFLVKRRDTCYRCPVQCKPVADYQSETMKIDGQYGGPEYETIGGFGPLCGVNDPLAVAKANELCAAYGLDTISTGGTLAFAMDCAEAGDLAGFEHLPRFGDGAALVENISRIARREGLGDLLAEGSARVAAQLGPAAQDRLAVARGQEFPLHDPRLKNTLAVGYALSPTGADHMHNLNDTFANFPFSDTCARLKELGFEAPLPLFGISPEKIRGLVYETAFKHVMDSAVICQFYPYEYRHIAAALSAAGGWDITPAEVHLIGLNITTQARRFLVREGFTHADDRLSARAYHKLTAGPIAGKALTPEELEAGTRAYFQMMGWDENGVPPQAA